MKRSIRIAAVIVVGGGGTIALLLWAKLKLVTGIPRTVYAQPESVEPGVDEPDEERPGQATTALVDDPAPNQADRAGRPDR